MEQNNKKINAGPLGLTGFGLTTILLNIHNAGLMELGRVIIGMGLALGGLMQIIAGIIEYKNNNNFGGLAFSAYGGFWWSLVFIWLSTNANFAVTNTELGFYFLVWGLFTAVMFVGTFKHNIITRVVFGLLMTLFLLLSVTHFFAMPVTVIITGYVGILTGLSALYSAAGQMLHEEFNKTFLPLF